jgi:uncharacterized protein YjiS (DUF1127 family)
MGLLKNIRLVWAQYREFRATLAELNGYSDRELAEFGIARSDIARVAYEKGVAACDRRRASHAPLPVTTAL